MSLQHRPQLNNIHDYIPGRSIESVKKQYNLSTAIKMASNENPLGPAVSFSELNDSFNKDATYYPDISETELIHQLAYIHSSNPENIIVGNGSDEIFQMIALALLDKNNEVITSQHTFSVYAHVARLMGALVKEVPMTNYTYSLDAMKQAITPQTNVIFIANPNNPTGTIVTDDALKKFVEQIPSSILVVIDEAYIDFSNQPSHMAWRLATTNVITTRTFSKLYGLAGLRIGYGVTNKAVIRMLQKVRQPFNVNNVAMTAASKALKHTEFVEKSKKLVEDGRLFFYQACHTLGLRYLPSEANFVCIFLPIPANDCFEALCKKGIIIRSLKSFGLSDAIRVTVGLPEHNRLLINELKTLL